MRKIEGTKKSRQRLLPWPQRNTWPMPWPQRNTWPMPWPQRNTWPMPWPQRNTWSTHISNNQLATPRHTCNRRWMTEKTGICIIQKFSTSAISFHFMQTELIKRQEIMLCHNARCYLDQPEDWIICVLLAMHTCNVWRNMLSRTCRSTGHHFKPSVG